MTHKNIDDYFNSLAHEDEKWNKQSKGRKRVPGTPISTVILKEDVKTDKIDDFFEALGTVCRYANHVVRDLFGAASSTNMDIFDDIFLNPTYEIIEENRTVTVPSTSAVIEVEEWNTGSYFSSTQMSLLEENENMFGLSSCEYFNFDIGTSGTYGWEVDPCSGVSRLYRTIQHDFEMGELGEGIVLYSSTNAEYKPITEDTIDDTPASHGNEMTTKGIFTCLDCTDSFEAKDAFKKHIATHEDYREFKCNVCDKRFRKGSDLKRHERIHTGERPYGCSECEKRFKSASDLRKHERIHSDERPFQCSVCEKRFLDRRNFRNHELLHSDETPFECSFCELRFRSKYHLQKHQNIHTVTTVSDLGEDATTDGRLI